MVRWGWIVLLLLNAGAASAQMKPAPTGPAVEGRKVFRANVDLVQLDVTVTDSDGKHVTDLTQEDFIIIQDARPREITSFSIVHLADLAKAGRPAKKAKSKDPDTTPAPLYSGDFRRSQVRRVIALVVDDLGISFEGMYYIHESLKKWVDEEMQPGDLVALIRTGEGIGTLQQFTADKRALHAAIERVTYNQYNRLNSDDAGNEFKRALILSSLGTIEYVLDGLRQLPGRKSLILFSENMEQVLKDSQGFSEFDHSIEDKMLKLVKEANKTAVVIHAIDTRGLQSESGDDSAQDGLVTLSKGTGGLFERNRNDIDGALDDTVRDGDVYYLLGYEPDEEMIAEMREGQTKHHSIRVSVKRSGLHVRTRKDFMGNPDPAPEPRNHKERVEQALYSPFASGNLPVRLTALFSRTFDGRSRINALLHFGADALKFSRDRDGRYNAEVELTVALFDAAGQQVDLAAKRMSLTVSEDAYREMKRNGVVIRSSIPAKKNGLFQMRAVISDAKSELFGSAMQYVEIPEIGSGRLALSGIAVASKQLEPEASPEGKDGLVVDKGVNGTPAVRIFEAGDTITWVYQVFNARTGDAGKARLKTFVRLFHQGNEIYAATPAEIEKEPEGNSGRLIGMGQMQLKQIASGGYDLQVVVKDMLAKDSQSTAVQSVHFEVRNPKVAKLR